jgi:hypothetical protein
MDERPELISRALEVNGGELFARASWATAALLENSIRRSIGIYKSI